MKSYQNKFRLFFVASICPWFFFMLLNCGHSQVTQLPVSSNNENDSVQFRQAIVEQLEKHTDRELREQIKQLMRMSQNSSGYIDPSILLAQYVADPMPVDSFDVNKKSAFNRFEANFTQLTLHGLRQLQITQLQAELGTLQCSIQIVVPTVRLQGHYTIDGKFTFLPLSGSGNFWFNITALRAVAWLRLEPVDADANATSTSISNSTLNSTSTSTPVTVEPMQSDATSVPTSTSDTTSNSTSGSSTNTNNQFESNANQSKVHRRLKVAEVRIDADADDLQLHFENLLGGGGWGALSNTLLNELSGLMFERVKQGLADEAERTISQYLDEQLGQTRIQMLASGSNTLLDSYLDNAREAIKNNTLDPFVLPNRTQSVGHPILHLILNGRLDLFDGRVRGLSTLRRTGDVLLTYEPGSVAFEAGFGFDNLSAQYSWQVNLMDMASNGATAVSAKKVNGYIKIRQPLLNNSHPTLEELSIKRLGNMWVDVTGLGRWDFVLQILINLVGNTFKHSLVDLVAGPAKDAVQQHFDQLKVHW